LAVVGLLAYGLFKPSTSNRIRESLAEGRPAPAPDFELPLVGVRTGTPPSYDLILLTKGRGPMHLRGRLREALRDDQLSLEELSGVPIVLNFWASWCNPCRKEAPLLERGWRRDQNRGVLYLGLNMQDLTENAVRFIEEFHLTYPSISEPSNDVGRAFGATGIPETHFIDPRGRVVGQMIGPVDTEALRRGVEAAIIGEVIGTMSAGQPGRAEF
jgi:cytochrome c biogenesis protein CcmG, thiol:disulfide interchange protein DsbE